MPERPDHVVAEIPRAARENLRIMLREKRGQVACELKVAEQDARGVMRETPRGVRVPLVRLADVIVALQETEREARRLGLISTAKPTAPWPKD